MVVASDVASLDNTGSVALSENANQKTENGNGVDKRGNTVNMCKIENPQRNHLTLNRAVWIIGRYNRDFKEIDDNAPIQETGDGPFLCFESG
jgi:hypothetical protein